MTLINKKAGQEGHPDPAESLGKIMITDHSNYCEDDSFEDFCREINTVMNEMPGVPKPAAELIASCELLRLNNPGCAEHLMNPEQTLYHLTNCVRVSLLAIDHQVSESYLCELAHEHNISREIIRSDSGQDELAIHFEELYGVLLGERLKEGAR